MIQQNKEEVHTYINESPTVAARKRHRAPPKIQNNLNK